MANAAGMGESSSTSAAEHGSRRRQRRMEAKARELASAVVSGWINFGILLLVVLALVSFITFAAAFGASETVWQEQGALLLLVTSAIAFSGAVIAGAITSTARRWRAEEYLEAAEEYLAATDASTPPVPGGNE